MNRKIAFRAWTGKQMIYQEKQYLASFIRRIVPQIILDHGGESFSQHESYLPNGGVIDEYLMQFTGLLDKHGKEIYEGDIVKGGSRPPFLIQVFGWFHGTEWEESCYGYTFEGFTNTEVEIIGNIYEDSTLLERGGA